MQTMFLGRLLTAVVTAGIATAAVAADKAAPGDLGARLYGDSCAVCHGAGGKGDGYGVEFLNRRPADLTVLAKNNGGVFPFERVYQVIDGRQAVIGHGRRDMPVWGRVFTRETVQAAEYYVDVPYDMETYARGRILAVIDYLNRAQAK